MLMQSDIPLLKKNLRPKRIILLNYILLELKENFKLPFHTFNVRHFKKVYATAE